jgi:3-oxoacyl-[acyl-carrier protein] reductase
MSENESHAPARTALITGATGGMGRRIAEVLAGQGWNLALAHPRSSDAADQLVKELTADGHQVVAHAADVADEAAVAELFDVATSHFGRLDAVVHTVGINRAGTVADLDMADFDDIHRTNVRGSFLVNQQAARLVGAGGSIVNVSSTVVRLAPPALSAYTASKAAIDALTRILSKELAGRDITVNAVAPGPTATQAFLTSTPAEEQEQLAEMAPLKRLGSPDDVASLVAFLLSPSGRWVNGQIVHSNGGVI